MHASWVDAARCSLPCENTRVCVKSRCIVAKGSWFTTNSLSRGLVPRMHAKAVQGEDNGNIGQLPGRFTIRSQHAWASDHNGPTTRKRRRRYWHDTAGIAVGVFGYLRGPLRG